MTIRVLTLLAFGLVCTGCSRTSHESKAAAQREPLVASDSTSKVAHEGPPDALPDASGWGVAGGLRYLEIIRGEAKPTDELPLLIVIHGRGDTPSLHWPEALDVEPGLSARMILPQAPTAEGDGFTWLAHSSRHPDQHGLARDIDKASEQLATMIGVLQKQRPTRGRALVAGFSQGAILSFSLALTQPALIEVALPISGMLPEPAWPKEGAKSMRFPPIHALHGSADSMIDISKAQALISHLQGLRYEATLHSFAGEDHTISPAMSLDARAVLSKALRAAR
jgi:phospholipase/carboxylesterase